MSLSLGPMFVTLHGKTDFADMIKLKILRWEDGCDYLCGSSVIPRVLLRGRQKGRSQMEGHVMKEAEKEWVRDTEQWAKGMKSSKLDKAKRIFPLEPLGENSSVIVDFWALELLREYIYVALSH